MVTIAPVTPGQVTVAVTARDQGGRAATLPVAVTVYPANRPPVAGTLADRKIRIDRPARVELTSAFTDPDEGDVLTYTAASSNEAVATAAVEGTGVGIAPKSIGQTPDRSDRPRPRRPGSGPELQPHRRAQAAPQTAPAPARLEQ